jgi:hypothetical protein
MTFLPSDQKKRVEVLQWHCPANGSEALDEQQTFVEVVLLSFTGPGQSFFVRLVYVIRTNWQRETLTLQMKSSVTGSRRGRKFRELIRLSLMRRTPGINPPIRQPISFIS